MIKASISSLPTTSLDSAVFYDNILEAEYLMDSQVSGIFFLTITEMQNRTKSIITKAINLVSITNRKKDQNGLTPFRFSISEDELNRLITEHNIVFAPSHKAKSDTAQRIIQNACKDWEHKRVKNHESK